MRFGTFFYAVIAIVLIIGVSNEAYSQKTIKKYNQAITGNPIGLAFGFLNATYEQQVSKDNSFTAFGSYWSFGGWTAFGVGGSYRWYLMQDDKKALEGLSFGPMVSLGFWSYDNLGYIDDWGSGTSFAIGAEGAYKFVFDGGFTVEPIVQIGFNVLTITGLDYRAFGLGCNIGYAW